jgi:hypothetical protein
MRGPWAFKRASVEQRFQKHLICTMMDRTRLVFTWNINVLWMITAAALYVALSGEKLNVGECVGLGIRTVGLGTITILYYSKWFENFKPNMARFTIWLTRSAFLLAGAVQAGLQQPDSRLKIHLIWCLYIGGHFLPDFTEFLYSSIIITYLELLTLILFGRACPMDSSRQCTNYEYLLQFNHHTVYLGVAIWINYHIHTDRRRDFMSSIRKGTLSKAQPPVPFDAQHDDAENDTADKAPGTQTSPNPTEDKPRRRPHALSTLASADPTSSSNDSASIGSPSPSPTAASTANPTRDGPGRTPPLAVARTRSLRGPDDDPAAAAAAAAAWRRRWAAAELPWDEAATAVLLCVMVSRPGQGQATLYALVDWEISLWVEILHWLRF